MSSITDIPAWLFRDIKRGFNKLRVWFFTVESNDRDLVIDASIDQIKDTLGDAYFTNGWELSYNYQGEDLNMRRPLRKDDKYEWYQTHVRGFEQDDGSTVLETHEDLEPTEHPYYHLNTPADANKDDKQAMYDVMEVLEENEISYRITSA